MVDYESAVSERGGFSQSALIRAGWTPTIIVQLLGAPDREVENPHYTHGAPMRLYDADRVRAAEQTEVFRVLQSVLRRKDRKPAPAPMSGSVWAPSSSTIGRFFGSWTEWHIVKCTDKTVSINDRPDHQGRVVYRLPRVPLERDGQVELPGYWGRIFYTDVGKARMIEEQPEANQQQDYDCNIPF